MMPHSWKQQREKKIVISVNESFARSFLPIEERASLKAILPSQASSLSPDLRELARSGYVSFTGHGSWAMRAIGWWESGYVRSLSPNPLAAGGRIGIGVACRPDFLAALAAVLFSLCVPRAVFVGQLLFVVYAIALASIALHEFGHYLGARPFIEAGHCMYFIAYKHSYCITRPPLGYIGELCASAGGNLFSATALVLAAVGLFHVWSFAACLCAASAAVQVIALCVPTQDARQVWQALQGLANARSKRPPTL